MISDIDSSSGSERRKCACMYYIPLFSAPQHSHVKMVFLLPVELSNRFPQSVQNTRDPTADILEVSVCVY